jgi:hypothetical protein
MSRKRPMTTAATFPDLRQRSLRNESRALLDRNRGDASTRQLIYGAEPRAHADARPDGPFDREATAVRMCGLPLRSQTSEPFVSETVVCFARQSRPRDDRGEGDKETQSIGFDRCE